MTEENTQSPEEGLEEFCEDDNSALPARTADEIAKLEDDLQHERDSRKEERFYWILALVISMDVSAFQRLGGVQVVFIFLLELVLLIPLAKYLGVDWMVELLKALLFKVLDKFPSIGK